MEHILSHVGNVDETWWHRQAKRNRGSPATKGGACSKARTVKSIPQQRQCRCLYQQHPLLWLECQLLPYPNPLQPVEMARGQSKIGSQCQLPMPFTLAQEEASRQAPHMWQLHVSTATSMHVCLLSLTYTRRCRHNQAISPPMVFRRPQLLRAS